MSNNFFVENEDIKIRVSGETIEEIIESLLKNVQEDFDNPSIVQQASREFIGLDGTKYNQKRFILSIKSNSPAIFLDPDLLV